MPNYLHLGRPYTNNEVSEFELWFDQEAREKLESFSGKEIKVTFELCLVAWHNGAYKEHKRIETKANKLLTTLLGD